MWLATTRGFYSAVQHRDNPDQVMVRARSHADLVNLLALAKRTPIARSPKIVEKLGADYPYRVTMSKADWKACVALLVDDIDYDNFKDAVARTNAPRAFTYHDVWFTLRRIEREPGAVPAVPGALPAVPAPAPNKRGSRR